MSQDIISDSLNQMMNAIKSNKESVELKRYSKLLISVLAIAKLKGYVKSYSTDKTILTVHFDKLNFCKSIKPRYIAKVDELEKYAKRYLPAKDFGTILVSTSKGIMTHQTAMDKGIGGCLIAYFY